MTSESINQWRRKVVEISGDTLCQKSFYPPYPRCLQDQKCNTGSLVVNNVAQVLGPFSPTCKSSTDKKVSYTLLYNEKTTPKFLNSTPYSYNLTNV